MNDLIFLMLLLSYIDSMTEQKNEVEDIEYELIN